MTNQSTIDKLIEMRFTAMADAFRSQLSDPKMKELEFEDRLGLLVDIEYNSRKRNRLKRLIKKAEFDQPEADVANIDYTSGRKLNRELTATFSSPALPAAVRLTWLVHSEWKPASSITTPSMCDFRIF